MGTAVKRAAPSRAAQTLVARGLVRGRVLDYGCGFGLDAETFGWEAYDPYYRPEPPSGPYDTIVCTLVLNVLTRNNRAKVLRRIQALLAPDGRAYLGVARNLPETGKLGVRHCVQNYVVLSLPVVAPERIAAPTLIVRGEFDGIAGFDDLLAFFARLPNANKQFAVLPGVAHGSLHQKNYRIVHHILAAFLAQPEPVYRG